MKTVFMFPGQGTQYTGMGKDIYDKYFEAREIYDKAEKILDIDIKKLCFESSQEELNKTENTQIAIAVTSLAVLEVLNKYNIKADLAVGLSLGEYVALMYAKYLSIEDGLTLLKKRGYYMGNFLPNEEFSMAAVIGTETSLIEKVCLNLEAEAKFVVPANYNCSSQTVISGNKEAVEEAIKILKGKGVRKIVQLKTSGPFHTKKLEKAKELYTKELKEIKFNIEDIKVDVIKNIDGTMYNKNDNFTSILSNHIVSPVRFDKALELMKKEKVNKFVEIGPGKTMSNFVKKEFIDENVEIYQTDNLENLDLTIRNLSKGENDE